MPRPTTFAIASIAILTGACADTTTPAGATETRAEAEICRQWGGSLPTRSRADTDRTKSEIQRAYAAFALVCPGWAHQVPRPTQPAGAPAV